MSAKLQLLTKEAILASKDIEVEDVPMPEWGGAVRMQTMLSTERDKWETAAQNQTDGDKVDLKGLKVLLIVKCARGADGKLLFTKEDLVMLDVKSAKAIDRLWQVASRMNGIGKEALEEARKNS